MANYFKKTFIRNTFEYLVNELDNELSKEGFKISGITDYQQNIEGQGSICAGKYKILAVYNPFLYKKMMMLAPSEGLILPCFVSMVELYPGLVSLVPYNPTEAILSAIESPSLQNLAAEVTRRLELVIHSMEGEQTPNPDLVTSWG